ncbi:MAG: hypothetical protein ACREM3_07520 [Candidatus Rokuibacteriota bacterium]
MSSERRSRSSAAPGCHDAAAGPPPRMVAVYRRGDAVCHARCGRPLALQGVRGLIEADFYCYTCLTHVTIPLVVLDAVPVEPVGALASSTAP